MRQQMIVMNRSDSFYERLHSILGKISKYYIVILIEDLNTQVGDDNTGYEHIMDRHEISEQTNNRENVLLNSALGICYFHTRKDTN